MEKCYMIIKMNQIFLNQEREVMMINKAKDLIVETEAEGKNNK